MKLKALIIASFCISATATYGKPVELDQKTLKAIVEKYLRDRGTLCVGKFVWPIDVSEQDRQIATNDAIQMPVLEKLGLVASSDVSSTGAKAGHTDVGMIKRYELTAAGKKFYLPKETTSNGPGGTPVVHHSDFCAAKLSLHKLIGWEPPTVINGHEQTTVTYTYKIAAADWTRNAEIQRVFPMVDRIIRGEETMQLKESFRLTNGAWVALNQVN